jgi:hypothetical protein
VERCVSCQFYDRNQRNADAKSPNAGVCRRAAPMLSPINQKSYMIEGVWPTVRDDDWCGEWKALVRRVDTARLSDVLGTSPAAMPTAMPASSVLPALSPRGAPATSLPPTPGAGASPRISAQAARAALSSLGVESRSVPPPPLSNLTGTGNGDD